MKIELNEIKVSKVIITAMAGASIGKAIRQSVAYAVSENVGVVCIFNGVEIEINPEDVCREYLNLCDNALNE